MEKNYKNFIQIYITFYHKIQSIMSIKSYTPKIVDLEIYNSLNDTNKKHIMKAEKGNQDSLVYVSSSFIIGKNDFPQSKGIGIEYLKYGTQRNDVKAIKQYGTYLLLGEIIPKDEIKGVSLLNEVATIQKDALQKLELAEILLMHQSFDIKSNANSDVNYTLAKQILKESADLGNTKAMVRYAKMCMKHKSNQYGEITPDFKEAYKYFNMSSQKGDPQGMYCLGTFLENGHGQTQINNKEAAKLYKKSYDKGDLAGCALYGYTLIEEKFGNPLNEIEGVKLIKYSCDCNNSVGINSYGYLVNLGLAGIDEDGEKAVKYYKKAADLGNAAAISNVGICYRDGDGFPKNVDLGLKYMKLAVEEGSPQAALNIATTISDTNFVSKVDNDEATKYFKTAIEMGSRSAISKYCIFILNDKNNLDDNVTEIRKYLNLGYKLRDKDTMRLQGAIYMDGGTIYSRDQERGVKIWKECVELGDMDAAQYLADLYQKGDVDIKADQNEAQKYRNMVISKSPKSKCCLLI